MATAPSPSSPLTGHLGYSSWRFSPTERGFDTYKGYLDGAESYWCHGGCGLNGVVDWWDSQARPNASLPLFPVFNETCHNGTDAGCPVAEYSATLLGDRAVELIHATPADPQKRPMFMYLAWQSGAWQLAGIFLAAALLAGFVHSFLRANRNYQLSLVRCAVCTLRPARMRSARSAGGPAGKGRRAHSARARA
eukprot:SAG22_NODE_25_length_30107_cov_28.456412_7_plen_193_part_00